MERSDDARQQLHETTITYGVYSAEPGGGTQEIVLRGADFSVRLTAKEDFQAPERTADGKIDGAVLQRLVELFEFEKFALMNPNEQKAAHADLRMLKVLRDKVEITIKRRGVDDVQFERLVGAVKLAAAMGVPAVSQGTFFVGL